MIFEKLFIVNGFVLSKENLLRILFDSGRGYEGIELSEEYYAISRDRILQAEIKA